MDASDWKKQAMALSGAARTARDPNDRDTLVVLAGDCEDRAAALEKAKATLLQERLAHAALGPGQENRIPQWRMKAEELRTAAENMTTPMARAGMQNAAASYDAMADQAEQARRGTPDEKSKAG